MEDQKKLDELLVRESLRGNTKTVKALLKAGADVHAEGDLALRVASQRGHTETVKALIDEGADVHAMNDAALRWASRYGQTETVKLLLESGADVHAMNDDALRAAALCGHTTIVKLLEAEKPTVKTPPVVSPLPAATGRRAFGSRGYVPSKAPAP
jgi:ankyrin repeat protein